MNEARRWADRSAARWADRLAARWPDTERRRSIASGLGFGASGALVALAITVVAKLWLPDVSRFLIVDEHGGVFGLPLAAGLGAAIAGAPLWWLLVEKPSDPPKGRGTLVGALVGVLTHPLMWFLYFVSLILVSVMVGSPPPDALADFGELLVWATMFSVVGLVITGIVTVPVAAGTGLALAHVRKGVLEMESEPIERPPEDL